MRVFDRDLSAPKHYQRGTHRTCDPLETIRRYQPVAPMIGLTRLANITGLDVIGIPVWVGIRPNSRGLSTSQGKGLTDAAAKASALMESVENWHAENIDRPVRVDSYEGLRRILSVVDLDGLSYYEDAPPRPDLPMPWIEGYDLLRNETCWVPLECVSTNYVVSARLNSANSFVQSSNGLASGNAILEAICHALGELIERDAVAQAALDVRHLNAERRIAPESLTDPDIIAVMKKLKCAEIIAALFDLTSDLSIPVYGCSIVDASDKPRWRSLPPFNGYGCHLSPTIALLRAVTEAIQSRLTYISGSRDDIAPTDYERGGNPEDLKSFRARLDQASPVLRFSARGDSSTSTFRGDVSLMLAALQAAGTRSVIVVNLTREDLGVPVVKVIVPGLAAPTSLLRARHIRVPERTRTKQRNPS